MAIGADLIEYIVIFGFFYFFLNALIRLANQDIEKPRKPPKQDDFYKAYSYAYDYVMVFHVYEEGEKKDIKKYMEKFSMRNIIDRITIAGMETSCFYSCQKDEVYMKIRASPSRLKAEADRINYKLALVKEKVRNRLQTGARDRSWKPVTLLLDKKLSSLDPFEYLYGKYSAAPEHESLYKRYKVGIKEHIFRGVDR
jgi:hypothetical protein